MRVKRAQLLAVLAVAVLALQPVTAAATQAGVSTAQFDDRSVATGAGDGEATVLTSPPDPETDRLGWENGVWYNESIDIDASDGIDRAEAASLLNRTMARVEVIRGVEFDEPVDLNFIDRSDYVEYAESVDVDPLSANVQLEALGFRGEDRNATAAIRERQGGFAAAFVVPNAVPELDLQAGDVTIVMDEGQASFSELTLGHELVHALQVQELNVTFRGGNQATDSFNARRGLIEGDASHVGYLYGQRCGADWKCVTPAASGGGPGFSDGAVGLAFLNYVQYSNGAEFVATLRDRGGWDAVNDAYDSFPNSTEQVIHPEAYQSDEPQTVTVPDRSSADWQPLTVDGQTAADTIGEAGLYTLLWFPSYESGMSVVIPQSAPFNQSLRAQSPFFYDYNSDATQGWDGDKLVPYVTAESAKTNETGYVWSTVWDSPSDAAAFEEAYVDILDYRGAEPVAGHENTYRVRDENPYGDAFYVNQTADQLLVVNAPSVPALSDVRAGAAPEGATPTETSTATGTATTTQTTTTTSAATTTDRDERTGATTTGGPGFGFVAALLAFLGLAVATRR
ncbi:Hvo_1808 family surface protein [Halorhabdus salina]|uniref:Hvo_1808 family surface protein n=1 Tax=Halorhabdus salina TaxID=2750670 RepID=UPI0015EEF37C|nr:Hvo_1808 family surface protein [Halorhabdus salina]